MKRVLLSVKGRQKYQDQEPDTIELVTEGTMEYSNGGWNICYEETELTGLAGVITDFRVENDRVILTRSGKLNSQMVFQNGVKHDSLYQMEFGALLLSVCANRILANLDESGGMIDLIYDIEIEHSMAGQVDYHLDISVIE